MFGANQQQIARIAEETVIVLKDLEARLEVLRNDLAVLCQSIGHPQAAQLALTPRGMTNVPQTAYGSIGSQFGQQGFGTQGLGQQGGQQGFGTQGIQSPFTQQGFGQQGQSPFTQQGFGQQGQSPFTQQGFGTQGFGSPFAQQGVGTLSPFALSGTNAFTSPWAQGLSPFGATGVGSNAPPWAFQQTGPYGINPFTANVPRF